LHWTLWIRGPNALNNIEFPHKAVENVVEKLLNDWKIMRSSSGRREAERAVVSSILLPQPAANPFFNEFFGLPPTFSLFFRRWGENRSNIYRLARVPQERERPL
jgi:hypothetical protein